jgi:gliding motility-associated-like protein
MSKCFYAIWFAGLSLLLCAWADSEAKANETDNFRAAAASFRANALEDTVAIVGLRFTYTFSASDFATVSGPGVNYSADVAGGTGLPGWLTFDPATLNFSGEPSGITGSFDVEVTASNATATETQTFTIAVRAVPNADINGPSEGEDHTVQFTEGDPPVEIASPLVLTDRDGHQLTFATITLRQRPNGTDEYIRLSPAGLDSAAKYNIIPENYNTLSGAIELKGSATLEQYEKVIREIVYMNESVDVVSGERDVAIQVKDPDGYPSNLPVTKVQITPVNDPTDIDLNGPDPGTDFATTFTERYPPVAIADSNIELDDIDYHNAATVTITITNRPDTLQETLEIIGGSLPGSISASFDSLSGVMTLSGAGSLDEYENAIQQVGYRNASQNPDLTQRDISIKFDDGDGGDSESTATTRVTIIPLNDPPDVHNDTITVAEYSLENVVRATLPYDVDNELSELAIAVKSLPSLGTLTYADGTLVKVGDRLDSMQFVGLQYDTPDNYDGTTAPGTWRYEVTDQDNETATGTVTFLINNAPKADDFTVTTDEDVNYVFTLADFADGYSDVEGDTLAFIVITSLPANGWLLLEDDTVQLADEIRVTALDSGKLVFVPTLNANGSPYTSFLFRAKDERAAVSEPYVVSIVVIPISDPPVVDTVLVAGEENETLYFTADDFIARFSDPENDALTKIRVESLPANGVLLLDNEPISVGDEIAVGALGQLSFRPNFGFDGTTQFRWNGHDGMAYAERSAPVIITLAEDNRISAVNDTIRLVDVITYDGSLVAQVINPTGGDFAFSPVPTVAPQHGTLTLLEDGSYTYKTTEDFSETDAFTFEVCNTNTPAECAQATITILVAAPLLVYEGFSPDSDGTNDVWRIRGIENYPNNTVRIFNGWGNLVFEITGYDNQYRAWSSHSTAGLVSGDVPDGTYFYLIDLGNNQAPRSGYVIVNR